MPTPTVRSTTSHAARIGWSRWRSLNLERVTAAAMWQPSNVTELGPHISLLLVTPEGDVALARSRLRPYAAGRDADNLLEHGNRGTVVALTTRYEQEIFTSIVARLLVRRTRMTRALAERLDRIGPGPAP